MRGAQTVQTLHDGQKENSVILPTSIHLVLGEKVESPLESNSAVLAFKSSLQPARSLVRSQPRNFSFGPRWSGVAVARIM